MVNCKRLLAVLATFLSFSGAMMAQEECGTDQMIARNPFLQQLYAERVACAPEVDLDTAQVLTIPVVFHIIHLGEAIGEGTNISDEQVLSCIDNLNHRFRGDTAALAALTDEYDEYELSLVKDSKIEFCLAARDPDNNPTDGIMRYDASDLSYTNSFSGQTSTAYYAEDGISNGSIFDIPLNGIPDDIIKQEYGWPINKYFNFYVVTEINGNNGGGGIQGYSYVGSMGTGATGYRYGPVCLYNVTGTVGELKWGRKLNSTWAHEIGHAFNLFHTFGASLGSDPSACGPETNPCTQGDQVPDTPPTSTNQSCVTPVCPDAMLQNYMDYTGENCKTAFTQGQIERMREEIWEGLSYLIYDNVSCQSPNGLDLGISNVSLPSSWCRDEISFNVKVSNFGNEEVIGAQISINGVSYPLPPIEGGDFILMTFTDFDVNDGVFEVEVIYEDDQYLDNNTITSIVDLTEDAWVEVIVTPDVWSNETDWEIADEFGELVMEGGDYPVFSHGEIFVEGSCLSPGCYAFIITDTANDGMSSWWSDPQPGYQIIVNGVTVVNYLNDSSFPTNNPDAEWSERSEEFCVTDCPTSYCPWDLDGDGIVAVTDLLIFLQYNGLQGECLPADFNFNGGVDSQDLIDMLDWYGYDCSAGEFIEGLTIPDWIWAYLDTTEVTEVTMNFENGVCLLGPPLYFDLLGRKVNDKARLTPGIYLVVENWSDGTITTRKEFRLQ